MIESFSLMFKGSTNGTYVTAALGGLFVLYAFSTQFLRVRALSTTRFCKGKNILLTGATGGLGKALAVQLSETGVKNLVLTGRDENSLALIAADCRKRIEAPNVHIIPCDLSDLDAVEKLASSTLDICEIDIFIHCGGISSRSSFLDTSIYVDKTIMTINFFSGALLAKKLVPGMVKKRSGLIIWISSVQGLFGTPYRTSYAASKFAVQGFCEALRSELTVQGISVHCVSPGYIKTNLSLSALKGDGNAYGKMDAATMNGADPMDVARSILSKVEKGKTDFVVAAGLSAKIAIILKFFAPSLLEKLLVKRFKKAETEKINTT